MKIGNKYGTHRVIEPKGSMPQAAQKIDNTPEIYNNEMLIDVTALNIDSASFHQIVTACEGDEERIKEMIMGIVNERGKMQNPVTGSGGILIGTVAELGPDFPGTVQVGDKVATLVSLSLTPLKLEEINKVHQDIDKVEVKGKAIIFESGIYAKLPDDMPETLAMAALDVAGAPAQAAKLARPGMSVLILGASGKSGIMCAYEARKRVGPTGRVVGMASREATAEKVRKTGFCHEVIAADANNPTEVLEKALAANNGEEYDLAINVVNIPNTEMSTILPVKDGGTVYFFSMATSFTKAALGAEGVGKDVDMIIGNGYTKGHAEITLEVLRESPILRELFEKSYQ
ncbi:MAG: L-erythro-3,5-diaminohexanoate dehydrogenase [Tissierellia bacterium]|mgnify:FL=1|jgi:L-erythro-3,5-diaminohexanoate dehydrogenase|nr:L-erythro-3,5-diaminohexanoate dehydrogenase [Bacillota bacterium]NLL22969.1 L-erythro-3,5-diaminohexanoate dehydrogenase [Tissierellia bacterium]